MTDRPALRIREVLFATDFSDCSDHALDAAVALAAHFGARLHLLHVVHRVNVAYHAPEREAAGVRMAALAAARVGADITSVLAVAVGAPAAEIVGYAEREKVDLLVMGTHGRTGLAHAVLGSVAEEVVRRAPCQVLTIRRPVEVPLAGPEAAPAHGTTPASPAEPAARRRRGICLVCAKPSGDLVCDTCRARIQAEAFYRKRADEKADTSGHLV